MARIAIVEDEPTLRADLVEFLKTCGHEAFGCESSGHVTDLLSRQPVDIFVLDINLPGENGFTIANRLRQNLQNSIGIIMLSSRSKSTDRVVGLEIGADAYLTKPVDLREVEAQIRAIERRLAPIRTSDDKPQTQDREDFALDLQPRHLDAQVSRGRQPQIDGQ